MPCSASVAWTLDMAIKTFGTGCSSDIGLFDFELFEEKEEDEDCDEDPAHESHAGIEMVEYPERLSHSSKPSRRAVEGWL